MDPNEEEQKVIEILTQHEVTSNPYGDPIHAVCKAMGWTESYSDEFVYNLVGQKQLEVMLQGPGDTLRKCKSYWKKGSGLPLQAPKP